MRHVQKGAAMLVICIKSLSWLDVRGYELGGVYDAAEYLAKYSNYFRPVPEAPCY